MQRKNMEVNELKINEMQTEMSKFEKWIWRMKLEERKKLNKMREKKNNPAEH